ncbi:MAG: DUF4383 domain-containing protein [Frankiaceae bacterium]|nr:DUF4383 domain-containing protein [Frankiaceae bacterium]
MRNRPIVQLVATAVAATFMLVAVLGFVPGITTDYSDLSLAGRESDAELLGLFQISVLHNIVHGLFGVIGLVLARSVVGARSFLLGGGAVYLVLFAYGTVIDLDGAANFLPLNIADNFLHLFLGASMIGLGVVLGKKAVRAPAAGH